jgi:hypothetical protein
MGGRVGARVVAKTLSAFGAAFAEVGFDRDDVVFDIHSFCTH